MTVTEAWRRINSWLGVNAPSGSFQLPEGATSADIDRAEKVMRCRLPEDVRESYRIHNGSNRIWLFQQGFLMPLGGEFPETEDYTVVGLWTGMLQCAEAMKNERGNPKGPIRTDWWNVGWIPLTENEGGDYICVDLVPEGNGHLGQIIDWWHEQAATVVLARSWNQWLSDLASRLDGGMCRFEQCGSGSIKPAQD